MFLTDGRLVQLNEDGTDGAQFIAQQNQKSLTIGAHHQADVVLNGPVASATDFTRNASAIYCEIIGDAFGRITIANRCAGQLHVNGLQIRKQRPLADGSRIEIGAHKLRWHCPATARPLTPNELMTKSLETAKLHAKTAASYSAPASNVRAKKQTSKVRKMANKMSNPRFTIYTRCPESGSMGNSNGAAFDENSMNEANAVAEDQEQGFEDIAESEQDVSADQDYAEELAPDERLELDDSSNESMQTDSVSGSADSPSVQTETTDVETRADVGIVPPVGFADDLECTESSMGDEPNAQDKSSPTLKCKNSDVIAYENENDMVAEIASESPDNQIDAITEIANENGMVAELVSESPANQIDAIAEIANENEMVAEIVSESPDKQIDEITEIANSPNHSDEIGRQEEVTPHDNIVPESIEQISGEMNTANAHLPIGDLAGEDHMPQSITKIAHDEHILHQTIANPQLDIDPIATSCNVDSALAMEDDVDHIEPDHAAMDCAEIAQSNDSNDCVSTELVQPEKASFTEDNALAEDTKSGPNVSIVDAPISDVNAACETNENNRSVDDCESEGVAVQDPKAAADESIDSIVEAPITEVEAECGTDELDTKTESRLSIISALAEETEDEPEECDAVNKTLVVAEVHAADERKLIDNGESNNVSIIESVIEQQPTEAMDDVNDVPNASQDELMGHSLVSGEIEEEDHVLALNSSPVEPVDTEDISKNEPLVHQEVIELASMDDVAVCAPIADEAPSSRPDADAHESVESPATTKHESSVEVLASDETPATIATSDNAADIAKVSTASESSDRSQTQIFTRRRSTRKSVDRSVCDHCDETDETDTARPLNAIAELANVADITAVKTPARRRSMRKSIDQQQTPGAAQANTPRTRRTKELTLVSVSASPLLLTPRRRSARKSSVESALNTPLQVDPELKNKLDAIEDSPETTAAKPVQLKELVATPVLKSASVQCLAVQRQTPSRAAVVVQQLQQQQTPMRRRSLRKSIDTTTVPLQQQLQPGQLKEEMAAAIPHEVDELDVAAAPVVTALLHAVPEEELHSASDTKLPAAQGPFAQNQQASKLDIDDLDSMPDFEAVLAASDALSGTEPIVITAADLELNLDLDNYSGIEGIESTVQAASEAGTEDEECHGAGPANDDAVVIVAGVVAARDDVFVAASRKESDLLRSRYAASGSTPVASTSVADATECNAMQSLPIVSGQQAVSADVDLIVTPEQEQSLIYDPQCVSPLRDADDMLDRNVSVSEVHQEHQQQQQQGFDEEDTVPHSSSVVTNVATLKADQSKSIMDSRASVSMEDEAAGLDEIDPQSVSSYSQTISGEIPYVGEIDDIDTDVALFQSDAVTDDYEAVDARTDASAMEENIVDAMFGEIVVTNVDDVASCDDQQEASTSAEMPFEENDDTAASGEENICGSQAADEAAVVNNAIGSANDSIASQEYEISDENETAEQDASTSAEMPFDDNDKIAASGGDEICGSETAEVAVVLNDALESVEVSIASPKYEVSDENETDRATSESAMSVDDVCAEKSSEDPQDNQQVFSTTAEIPLPENGEIATSGGAAGVNNAIGSANVSIASQEYEISDENETAEQGAATTAEMPFEENCDTAASGGEDICGSETAVVNNAIGSADDSIASQECEMSDEKNSAVATSDSTMNVDDFGAEKSSEDRHDLQQEASTSAQIPSEGNETVAEYANTTTSAVEGDTDNTSNVELFTEDDDVSPLDKGDAERDGDAHSNDDLATELAAIAVKVEPTSFRVDDDVADDDMFADESVSVKLEESSMLQTNIDNDEKQGESTVTKSEPECSKTAVDSLSLPVANGSLQRSDDSPVSKSESIAPGSSDAAADVNVVEKPQSEQEQQQSDSTEKMNVESVKKMPLPEKSRKTKRKSVTSANVQTEITTNPEQFTLSTIDTPTKRSTRGKSVQPASDAVVSQTLQKALVVDDNADKKSAKTSSQLLESTPKTENDIGRSTRRARKPSVLIDTTSAMTSQEAVKVVEVSKTTRGRPRKPSVLLETAPTSVADDVAVVDAVVPKPTRGRARKPSVLIETAPASVADDVAVADAVVPKPARGRARKPSVLIEPAPTSVADEVTVVEAVVPKRTRGRARKPSMLIEPAPTSVADEVTVADAVVTKPTRGRARQPSVLIETAPTSVADDVAVVDAVVPKPTRGRARKPSVLIEPAPTSVADDVAVVDAVVPKPTRGRPRKPSVLIEPVIPTVESTVDAITPKPTRGRPRKASVLIETTLAADSKPIAAELAEPTATPRKTSRGRQRKSSVADDATSETTDTTDSTNAEVDITAAAPKPSRLRGRKASVLIDDVKPSATPPAKMRVARTRRPTIESSPLVETATEVSTAETHAENSAPPPPPTKMTGRRGGRRAATQDVVALLPAAVEIDETKPQKDDVAASTTNTRKRKSGKSSTLSPMPEPSEKQSRRTSTGTAAEEPKSDLATTAVATKSRAKRNASIALSDESEPPAQTSTASRAKRGRKAAEPKEPEMPEAEVAQEEHAGAKDTPAAATDTQSAAAAKKRAAATSTAIRAKRGRKVAETEDPVTQEADDHRAGADETAAAPTSETAAAAALLVTKKTAVASTKRAKTTATKTSAAADATPTTIDEIAVPDEPRTARSTRATRASKRT